MIAQNPQCYRCLKLFHVGEDVFWCTAGRERIMMMLPSDHITCEDFELNPDAIFKEDKEKGDLDESNTIRNALAKGLLKSYVFIKAVLERFFRSSFGR